MAFGKISDIREQYDLNLIMILTKLTVVNVDITVIFVKTLQYCHCKCRSNTPNNLTKIYVHQTDILLTL